MTLRRGSFGAWIAIFVACSGADDTSGGGDDNPAVHPWGVDATPVFVRAHDTVTPETAGEWRNQTLCETAFRMDGGAGLYRVLDVTGIAERSPDAPVDSIPIPHTYVEIERIADWSGDAPETVVLRLDGGPTGPNAYVPVAVRLVPGEQVGLLLRGADPGENEGFADVAPAGVWRVHGAALARSGVGPSVTAEELEARVRAAYDSLPDTDQPRGPACPPPMPWNTCPVEALWPAEAEHHFPDAPCD